MLAHTVVIHRSSRVHDIDDSRRRQAQLQRLRGLDDSRPDDGATSRAADVGMCMLDGPGNLRVHVLDKSGAGSELSGDVGSAPTQLMRVERS